MRVTREIHLKELERAACSTGLRCARAVDAVLVAFGLVVAVPLAAIWLVGYALVGSMCLLLWVLEEVRLTERLAAKQETHD